MFRNLNALIIVHVIGFSVAIAGSDGVAQTVGSYASTVDTSSGGSDFITSSSPLPNGGVIMSSQYPGDTYGDATFVAEAPMTAYDNGQGYAYGQGYGYAENYGYVQQPAYVPQQVIYQAPANATYAQPYQYSQVMNQQAAPVYAQQPTQPVYQQQADLNLNYQVPNQPYQQAPTSLVSYQTQPAPAAYPAQAAPISYLNQSYTAPVYQPTSYQQQNYQNQWQANSDTRVAQLNTQNQDPAGLQWQPAGTASYTAQAPNCCGTQPPTNPYAYAPAPNPQYAPTAPAYAPYGATNPNLNRAQWRPLIPLRALPPGVYVGQGIVGQPVAYVDKEPFRNFLRYISP